MRITAEVHPWSSGGSCLTLEAGRQGQSEAASPLLIVFGKGGEPLRLRLVLEGRRGRLQARHVTVRKAKGARTGEQMKNLFIID